MQTPFQTRKEQEEEEDDDYGIRSIRDEDIAEEEDHRLARQEQEVFDDGHDNDNQTKPANSSDLGLGGHASEVHTENKTVLSRRDVDNMPKPGSGPVISNVQSSIALTSNLSPSSASPPSSSSSTILNPPSLPHDRSHTQLASTSISTPASTLSINPIATSSTPPSTSFPDPHPHTPFSLPSSSSDPSTSASPTVPDLNHTENYYNLNPNHPEIITSLNLNLNLESDIQEEAGYDSDLISVSNWDSGSGGSDLSASWTYSLDSALSRSISMLSTHSSGSPQSTSAIDLQDQGADVDENDVPLAASGRPGAGAGAATRKSPRRQSTLTQSSSSPYNQPPRSSSPANKAKAKAKPVRKGNPYSRSHWAVAEAQRRAVEQGTEISLVLPSISLESSAIPPHTWTMKEERDSSSSSSSSSSRVGLDRQRGSGREEWTVWDIVLVGTNRTTNAFLKNLMGNQGIEVYKVRSTSRDEKGKGKGKERERKKKEKRGKVYDVVVFDTSQTTVGTREASTRDLRHKASRESITESELGLDSMLDSPDVIPSPSPNSGLSVTRGIERIERGQIGKGGRRRLIARIKVFGYEQEGNLRRVSSDWLSFLFRFLPFLVEVGVLIYLCYSQWNRFVIWRINRPSEI